MTTNTAHANCSHPATKGARRACRDAARTERVRIARAAVEEIAIGDQLAKALELLELGAVRHQRGLVFRVVSSHGDRSYVTHVDGHCTCPHGLRRHRDVAPTRKDGTPGAFVCYHVLATWIRAAQLSPRTLAA